jgi:hypothetical protein
MDPSLAEPGREQNSLTDVPARLDPDLELQKERE